MDQLQFWSIAKSCFSFRLLNPLAQKERRHAHLPDLETLNSSLAPTLKDFQAPITAQLL
jgi:hypothetical protein